MLEGKIFGEKCPLRLLEKDFFYSIFLHEKPMILSLNKQN